MTTPTGGTDHGDPTLVDALAQLSFLIQGALAEATADHDLSIIQARLLGILRDREPTMNELGAHLTLDKSSITGLVDRAERRGLVHRAVSARDRRAIQVRVTEAGRRLTDQISTAFDQRVLAITAPLTDAERTRLTVLVTRLLGKDRNP